MKLRVFRAARMADAMAEVRAVLGVEAVILGSRRVGGAVEVTAALEPDLPAAPVADPILIPPAPSSGSPHPVAAGLARHNLPAGLAAALAQGGPGDLTARLAARLAFGPLPGAAPRPLLLAGPPGAGKTLSCAKLAARLLWAGTPPLVVSTDQARAGATAQIAAYTQLMGLMLAVAETPVALDRARAHAGRSQPVLIDTEGCDPFSPAEARALLALVRAVEAEVVLVLPAGLDPAEAADLARGFKLLGARHLLPTRLDQARRLGGVLAAAEAAGLILAEAGTGPGVAEGLTPLTPDWLVERLRAGGPMAAAA